MKILILLMGIYAMTMFSLSYFAMFKEIKSIKKRLKASVIFVPSLLYILFTLYYFAIRYFSNTIYALY